MNKWQANKSSYSLTHLLTYLFTYLLNILQLLVCDSLFLLHQLINEFYTRVNDFLQTLAWELEYRVIN